MTAGHQGRPAWRALGLWAVVGEARAFLRERIDPGGCCSSEWTAGIATQLAEPEIVDVEEQDVGPSGHFACTNFGRALAPALAQQHPVKPPVLHFS